MEETQNACIGLPSYETYYAATETLEQTKAYLNKGQCTLYRLLLIEVVSSSARLIYVQIATCIMIHGVKKLVCSTSVGFVDASRFTSFRGSARTTYVHTNIPESRRTGQNMD